MKHKNNELDKLTDIWYEKLAKSGFKDIEQRDGNLKEWSSTRHKKMIENASEDGYKAKETYFQMVGKFLHDHKFENALDKKIWQYHAEGESVRGTSKLLKAQGIKKAPTQVKETIHRIRAIMYSKPSGVSNDD